MIFSLGESALKDWVLAARGGEAGSKAGFDGTSTSAVARLT
jgi:hypothetical protein